ncbi:element excision factor XisI family protein [Tolypothrix sp. FACHB-123]|nr:element excision factor XisI family protein [Tolypothrix sp. FACHB-123]
MANDLVSAGVPKEDIVLAFHEPKMWQYTDFADFEVPQHDF